MTAKNTYLRKILKLIPQDKTDSTFSAFTKTIVTQLRAKFRDKYSEKETLNILQDSYQRFTQRDHKQMYIELLPTERGTTLYSIQADQPFIVDTIRVTLQKIGISNINKKGLLLSKPFDLLCVEI